MGSGVGVRRPERSGLEFELVCRRVSFGIMYPQRQTAHLDRESSLLPLHVSVLDGIYDEPSV